MIEVLAVALGAGGIGSVIVDRIARRRQARAHAELTGARVDDAQHGQWLHMFDTQNQTISTLKQTIVRQSKRIDELRSELATVALREVEALAERDKQILELTARHGECERRLGLLERRLDEFALLRSGDD